MKIVTDKTPKVDVASILTEAEIHDIHEFMHHYPQSRAASLDALKIVQRRNGWVDDAQVNAIANILKIPVTDVEGVATFYNAVPQREEIKAAFGTTPTRLHGYDDVYREIIDIEEL